MLKGDKERTPEAQPIESVIRMTKSQTTKSYWGDGDMAVAPDFENLVNLYYQDLYRFGLSLTRSEADACDLTQQTFYVWANKGHQLKDLTKVKGWLFTTLHREFLQMSRRQERFSGEPISEVAQDLPDVSADVVNRMDAQTMLEVLGQIDESYRAPLVLYYSEDLSYKEIADVLEVPLGTVQSRIARAKSHLFQLLSETNHQSHQSQ
jgi:RNA polymerase sigma-70 factor, ECF subfamily